MTILEQATLASKNLLRTKGRSILTMLGMIIGVASVIMMLSVGKATERFILSQVASFGSDLIIVGNGRGDGSDPPGPDPTIKRVLDEDDYFKLRSKTWVRSIDAAFFTNDLVTHSGVSGFVNIGGTSDLSPDIFSGDLATGRYLDETDVLSKNRVAVLGAGIAEEFFGFEDPIGKRIKIGDKSYRVIGVMQEGGTRFFQSVDRQIYVPFTTIMQDQNAEHLFAMFVKTIYDDLETGKSEIRYVLRDSHHINNSENDLSEDDFVLRTQADAQERAGIIGTILSILLGAIAAISLLVGGIGIMNIMYVSVKERTREIGLRKAIGARGADILKLFLVEAVIITVLGGVIGILAGTSFSWVGLTALGSYQSGWSFEMPYDAIALGFTVSCAIGILFGYLPAKKAASLQAIEALRYE